MPFFSWLKPDDGMGQIMGHRPERFLPLAQYTDTVLRGPSELSIAEREMIAAFVSGVNECEFCHGSHAAVAVAYGIDAQMFEKIMADVETAPIDPKWEPLLRYLRKLTVSPAKLVQADFDAVIAAGWSETAFEDAISVAALFNLYNRMVEGHGIKGGWRDYFPKLREMLEVNGYQGRLRQSLPPAAE